MTAQEWLPPALTLWKVWPGTRVGWGRSTVDSSPSWPRSFAPQQYRAWSDVVPHTCASPAESVAKVSAVDTNVGAATPAAGPPPQQYATPSRVNPQVKRRPAVSRLNWCSPTTTVGSAVAGDMDPMPSWPASLLPQQTAGPAGTLSLGPAPAPRAAIAQECHPPAVICVSAPVAPGSPGGVGRSEPHADIVQNPARSTQPTARRDSWTVAVVICFMASLVDCNSIPVHTDAVAGIGVTPDEWMTMLVMGPDVLHEFPTEIGR